MIHGIIKVAPQTLKKFENWGGDGIWRGETHHSTSPPTHSQSTLANQHAAPCQSSHKLVPTGTHIKVSSEAFGV